MKIIIASSNKGKLKEIHKLLPTHQTIAYSDILGSFEIVEDGHSFKENAIIKAQAVVNALKKTNYKEEYIVIADDSGITVPALNNEPGIYSARYAGENATDSENINKLISKLQNANLHQADAFYTAAIAISYKDTIYTTHGWMHGKVCDEKKGENGFGYDPIFIPKGLSKTLGELDDQIKKDLGHRSKALNLAMKVINSITKKR